MAYENEMGMGVEADIPHDSEIIKKLSKCLESVEGIHGVVSDLRKKLSPVTRLAETKMVEPSPETLASTKVGETIQQLETRINSVYYKINELVSLIEV